MKSFLTATLLFYLYGSAFAIPSIGNAPAIAERELGHGSHSLQKRAVAPITSSAEFKSAINHDGFVVVDFFATWCGPCKLISPIYDKISAIGEPAGIKFYKVDVDEQEAISQEFGIRSKPTFVVFKNGTKVDELEGADPVGLLGLLLEVFLLSS